MDGKQWARRGTLLLIVGAIALAQRVMSLDETHWHYVFPRLYYVPIVLAALYDGWRGGLLFALLSGAAFFPQFLYGSAFYPESLVDRYLEVIAFCTLAVLTGVHTDRERRQKRNYQEVASKLSEVYQTLQVNFEAMKRAERLSAIGHLSAGLAHEIRNPLASIAGAASIIRRTQPTDEKVLRCIAIIESECSRLNGLLTNFLNFARPRSPQIQSVNLNKLLSEVIELAEHAVHRRQVQFRMEVSDSVTEVDCDPEQLRQVLLNLVINAVEASEEGSTVHLFAGIEDETIVIRVADEGSGVSPEDVDKLFDPFFTTKETGTGLGLPVAHQIIAHMGGNLSARRNAHRGMTFSVALPLIKRTTPR
jgi:two-component system sensor histidine kinase HydH